MNSQTVLIKDALRSKFTFVFLACLVPISLFLKAGFISVSVIWFFTLCLYNYSSNLKDKFRTYYLLLFPIFLYILFVIGILFSENPEAAVNIAGRKIHLFLLPLAFIIVNKTISGKDVHVILVVFLTSCFLFSLVCIGYAAYNVFKFNSLSFYSGSQNYYYFISYPLTDPLGIPPVYVSMFCNLALLVTLNSPLIRRPVSRAVIAVYLAVFIILCGSNAGVTSLTIIIILWLLGTGRKKSVLYGLTVLSIVIIAVVIYYPVSVKEKFLHSFKFNYTDESGRISDHTGDKLMIWELSIDAIKENIVLGYGTADGQKALEEKYEENDLVHEKGNSLNAHHEFLSTTLDLGIFGFITLMAMLIIPLVQAIKVKDPIAIGFILLSLVFFCAESVLVRQKGIVFFSFFYSFLFSQLVGANGKNQQEFRRKKI